MFYKMILGKYTNRLIIMIGILHLVIFNVYSQPITPYIARYLGGLGKNEAIEVRLIANQQLIVAGNFDNIENTNPYTTISSSRFGNLSKARLITLESDNLEYLSVYNIGNQMFDCEYSTDGYLFVAGDWGLTKLSLNPIKEIWTIALSQNGSTKLAVNNDGKIVCLIEQNLYVYSQSDGALLAYYISSHEQCNDIKFNGNKLYLCGQNTKLNSGFNYCSLLAGNNFEYISVGFIDILEYSTIHGSSYGSLNIKRLGKIYDFEGNSMSCDMGNTNIHRLAVSPNGSKLFALCSSFSKNNIFRWDGTTNWQMNGGVNPASIYFQNSSYTSLSNFAEDNQFQFIAQIDLNSSKVTKGVFVNTIHQNLNSGLNSFDFIDSNNGAIEVDKDDNLFIGAKAGNGVRNRQSQNLFNQTIGNYYAGEPSIMTLNPSLGINDWGVFSSNNCSGSVVSIDIKESENYYEGSKIAILASLESGNAIVNRGIAQAYNPLDTDNANEAYLILYRKESQVTSTNNTPPPDEEPQEFIQECDCIKINNTEDRFWFTIYDTKGTILKQGISNQNPLTINKSEFRKGVYIVKVVNSKTSNTYKFDTINNQ